MSITLIIIIITALVSFAAFTNEKIINDLIFAPTQVTHQKQWYRFFSSGFIHTDWPHLIFNMFSLFLFGQGMKSNGVESVFTQLFQEKGKLLYLAMYLLALFFALLPTYFKNKDNYSYRGLGASGAVSAVIFAGILLFPTMKIGLYFIPPIIPGFVYGPLYIIGSYYLDKKQADNINHSAHIWGALFGVAFMIVAAALFSNYPVLKAFMLHVQAYFGM